MNNMYKFHNIEETLNKCCDNTNSYSFLQLFKRKWDELHESTDVFRYKINSLEERIVDGKYLLQLNPDRKSKRRIPENIKCVSQPFDPDKFNFTQVRLNEILLTLEEPDKDIHKILVNVSPISKYHSLLCPSINKCLPQIVTTESLNLAINIMFMAHTRDMKMGFNSLCAFASVNHLHYHIFVEKKILPIEQVKWIPIKQHLNILDKEYPVPAFCFEVPKCATEISKDIYTLLEYFLKRSVAHNVLLTRRRLDKDDQEAVYVIIWPRKSTIGVKKLEMFNVAVLELSGWFPVYDTEDYKKLNKADLERELEKWKIDEFDSLCEEIKCLY